MNMRWFQRCLHHPRSTWKDINSVLSLSRSLQSIHRHRPLSLLSSCVLRWQHYDDHVLGMIKFYPGVICVRGARGKPATKSKAGPATLSTPPLKDTKADTECKGANILKEGSDPPLREDSEYPDWLWELAEPKRSHQELSPDTTRYWRRLRKEKAHERNVLMKQLGRV